MKQKVVLLLIVAVGCGVCGCGKRASRTFTPVANAQPQMVTVLVARQKIPMGTLVKDPEQHFELKQFAKGTEPRKALTSFDQVKDRRLNKPLAAEQFVTSEDLLDPVTESASRLPAGMRAIAIRVKIEEQTHGFILPNSRVDVILTVIRGDHDSYSRIIAQNMLVLAVDALVSDPRDRGVPPCSVVTLAATPEQAEQLREATSQGELRLILRAPGDDKTLQTERVQPPEVGPVQPSEPPLPAGMRPVTINLRSELLGGGFLLPGSRVDVLITIVSGDYDSFSRVFIKNILVLAVDSWRVGSDSRDQPYRPIVLAATPEEAERLQLARSLGELRWILRDNGEAPRIQAVEVQAKIPRSGGFIARNSLVDVVITSFEDPNVPLSHLLLTDVRVLATQLLMPRETEEKPLTVPALVTLALTPQQAEKVAAAQEKAMVRLMVRLVEEEKIPPPRLPTTDLPRVPADD